MSDTRYLVLTGPRQYDGERWADVLNFTPEAISIKPIEPNPKLLGLSRKRAFREAKELAGWRGELS